MEPCPLTDFYVFAHAPIINGATGAS